MERISIRENGLVGTLFRKGSPSSAILLLSGSSGGWSEEAAELLASNGFATLALAYFAAESLPPTLSRIPVEYFEKGIERLENEPGIERIGLWGRSRGAELSLILGTFFPDRVHAIAVHVPSSVVYGALDDHTIPAWTYLGQPIGPLAPLGPLEPIDPAFGQNKETAIATTPYFLQGMEDKQAFAAAAIPVEKIRCPLLLISGQEDQIWPSSLFAQQIVERLATYASPIYYKHMDYPGAGHAPSLGNVGFHPVMKRWLAYGGHPKDNAFAAEDGWRQTILFFQTVLFILDGGQL